MDSWIEIRFDIPSLISPPLHSLFFSLSLIPPPLRSTSFPALTLVSSSAGLLSSPTTYIATATSTQLRTMPQGHDSSTTKRTSDIINRLATRSASCLLFNMLE